MVISTGTGCFIFKDEKSHCFGRALQHYYLPSDWARELFKPSTDSESFLVRIELSSISGSKNAANKLGESPLIPYSIDSESAPYGAPGLSERNLGLCELFVYLLKYWLANLATVQRSNNGINKIYCGALEIMVNLFMGSITQKVWEPLPYSIPEVFGIFLAITLDPEMLENQSRALKTYIIA